MISFEEMREIEPDLKDKNDQELEEIRNLMYGLGRLVLERFIESKTGSKYPLRVPGQSESNKPELEQCKTEKKKKE